MNCTLRNKRMPQGRRTETGLISLTRPTQTASRNILRRHLGIVFVCLSISACTHTSTASLEQQRVMHLAREVERQGDAVSARALFERAAVLSDEAPATMLELGRVRLTTGDLKGAESAFQSVLVHQPDSKPALLGLGTVQLYAGDFKRAEGTLAMAAHELRSVVAYNRWGGAAAMAGRSEIAVDAFTAALALEPDNLELRSNLALALVLTGQLKAALDQIARVVAAPEAGAKHLRRQALILIFAGDARGAAVSLGDMPVFKRRELIAQARAIKALQTSQRRAVAIGLVTPGEGE